ncbi:hypothetical protein PHOOPHIGHTERS_37 [Serratia phage vB_SmaS_PhooPhighters]|uniref:Putative N-actylmannosamine-6-phosphate 2-epimerase n=1 Tax=Serratia phage vB_SmaS_Rovert TaxID=2777363 RepID=A0A7T3N9S0_9CAUD|nr:putative N-actylmannosamine-6-phosphate 2-epimerase [Serratia phage vB_SmaS_Rovert]QPX74998.1 putative N-actylmannosamine-6-phosphate 2-epimerase [Serratia phage vB_SmaS_Rovert]UGO51971.1 hypothetical protein PHOOPHIGHTERS_37 [Serratia phage vB_SmaS_PhooPhighters]
MIIHSAEYFIALRKELLQLKEHISKQIYGKDVVYLNSGIDNELALIDMIGSNVSCMNCVNRKGTISPEGFLSDDSFCAINGKFPEDLNVSTYRCGAWLWEDVPF